MPQLHSYDPQGAVASVDTIATFFRQFCESPIRVGEYTVQCDPTSLTSMQNALDTWHTRPTIPNWFYQVGDQYHLRWKMADNTTHLFDKRAFMEFMAAVGEAKAIRTQQLWAKAQQFKADGAKLRVVQDIQKWLTP